MPISWEQRFAQRTRLMHGSAIRELLKVTERPDFISFAGGLPAPEVFPVEEVASAAQQILHKQGTQALQYGATEGYRPLREFIAQQMTEEAGFPVSLENVLITTGSQQALDLLGKTLVDPGDTLLVESPTYLAALQAWNAYGAKYHEVAADEQGLQIEALESALTGESKFLYTIPNFQNPSGVTLSLERRERLVEMAHRAGLLIIEDDPYRELRFEGAHLPRLFDLDGQRQASASSYTGNVVYINTFSKVLAPGLRVGWMVAAAELINKLVQAKQGTDLHTATLNQMLAYELAQSGFIRQHLPITIRAYRERRDAMLAALAQHFPEGVRWTHPQGGMFLWVTLPAGIDTEEMLRAAIDQKVAFVPGTSFHPTGGGTHTMRLNFSNARPDAIYDGIARLSGVLQPYLYPGKRADSHYAVSLQN
jgi:2-aminoadipate transaminase